MFDSMPIKIVGSRDVSHAHFQGKFLCAHSSFPTQINKAMYQIWSL